jgi:NADPH-dependent curcumin reductase CurA
MSAEAIPTTSRELRLVSRPADRLTQENFELVEVPTPVPGDGEVLVRNEWMFLGSVYRDLMNAETSLPIPNYEIGATPWGTTVGTVVVSNNESLPVGTFVLHYNGWREWAVVSPEFGVKKLDRSLLPGAEYFLANGPTAWRGIVEMADAGEGDVVFVSGATGAVGSLAGQIAKARGAKLVIGSTGSKEKVDFLVNEAGFDAAFDYHDGPVLDRLRELAPDGITVCFDNVGGDQFEAAVEHARPGARFALCGALSGQIGGTDGDHPRLALMRAIAKQLTFRGFATFDTEEQLAAWNQTFAGWLNEGRISFAHTVVKGGVAAAADAFIALLDKKYAGTVVLQLND